jgi:hypothetical protein
MATATVNPNWAPKCTVTVDDDGNIEAIVEIDELEPTRETTAEERGAGITSLDPPTVSIQARATTYDTHRAVIDGCLLAVAASADATDGSPGGIGPLFMMQLRTAIALRWALRECGEDI